MAAAAAAADAKADWKRLLATVDDRVAFNLVNCQSIHFW